jgi:hypothetical protein
MPTRTIKGTLDNLQVSGGSEISFLGPTTAGNVGDLTRAFKVDPSTTGDIIVRIDKSTALLDIEIFQDDAYNTGNAPTGYQKIFNIAKAGKGKGAIGITVTNAAKFYVVLLTFDSYADAEYTGSVLVP